MPVDIAANNGMHLATLMLQQQQQLSNDDKKRIEKEKKRRVELLQLAKNYGFFVSPTPKFKKQYGGKKRRSIKKKLKLRHTRKLVI